LRGALFVYFIQFTVNLLTHTHTRLQETPVADAKPDDIKDLLGGALFKALYKWMVETGPVYLLPTGPASSFLVVSDPAAAQHVLQRSDNPKNNVYGKGLVAEVSEFLFGVGFVTTGAVPVPLFSCLESLPNLALQRRCKAKLVDAPANVCSCTWKPNSMDTCSTRHVQDMHALAPCHGSTVAHCLQGERTGASVARRLAQVFIAST
jgi:hypothetical protein